MLCKITIDKNLLKYLVKLSWFLQELKIYDLQTKIGVLETKVSKMYALELKFGGNDCNLGNYEITWIKGSIFLGGVIQRFLLEN